jgi:hypothetical protein
MAIAFWCLNRTLNVTHPELAVKVSCGALKGAERTLGVIFARITNTWHS